MSDKDSFREPDPAELTGPRTVQHANWIAWRAAETRERRALESNRRLTSEVRDLDRRCTRLQAEQQTARTRNVVGTISVALASVFGGSAATAAYASASNGMVVVLGIVAVVFLVFAAVMPWLLHGSESATPPGASRDR